MVNIPLYILTQSYLEILLKSIRLDLDFSQNLQHFPQMELEEFLLDLFLKYRNLKNIYWLYV